MQTVVTSISARALSASVHRQLSVVCALLGCGPAPASDTKSPAAVVDASGVATASDARSEAHVKDTAAGTDAAAPVADAAPGIVAPDAADAAGRPPEPGDAADAAGTTPEPGDTADAAGTTLEPVDAADPMPEPGPDPFGLTPAEVADLIALRRPDAPPPDPTNVYADDAAAGRFGHRLFFDTTLSHNGLNSCSGCHWPDRYFSGRLTYDGHGGLDFRNVPSLVEVSHQDWLFWDGRADTLWAQARTPIESAHELDFDRVRLAHFIHERPAVRVDYEAAFGPLPDAAFWSRIPDRAKPSGEAFEAALDTAWADMEAEDRQQVNRLMANVGKGLAAFERTLVTGPAPFDEFTLGLETGDAAQLAALSESALRGLRLFMGEAGCVRCHSGPTFSDSAFHNLGVSQLPGGPLDLGRSAGIPQVLADAFNAAGPYSDDPAGPRAQRLARLDVDAEDVGAFRTASLRNVSETSPYLHDGRFLTLDEVIRFKATLPEVAAVGVRDPRLAPFDVSDQDVADLVAFLQSLTAPPVAEALRTPLPE